MPSLMSLKALALTHQLSGALLLHRVPLEPQQSLQADATFGCHIALKSMAFRVTSMICQCVGRLHYVSQVTAESMLAHFLSCRR